MKGVRTIGWAVAHDDSDIRDCLTVRHDGRGIIVVGWPCGDERSFARNDITYAIATVELLQSHPDVVLELADTHGEPFAIHVVDGDMYAAAGVHDIGPDADSYGFPWKSVKKALAKATAP